MEWYEKRNERINIDYANIMRAKAQLDEVGARKEAIRELMDKYFLGYESIRIITSGQTSRRYERHRARDKEIIEKYLAGATARELAHEYNLTDNRIAQITYSHRYQRFCKCGRPTRERVCCHCKRKKGYYRLNANQRLQKA